LNKNRDKLVNFATNKKNTMQTAERVSHIDISDNYVYQRSVLAYHEAAKLISGRVLEIGTGSGYGVEIIAPNALEFTTIDKFESTIDKSKFTNVKFLQMNVPPLQDIPDCYFDFVISFQVIEHIVKDKTFVKEICRVLKSNGKFIVSTPNKTMSITRNPWHVREYTISEFENLLTADFNSVDKRGVFGNEKIMKYYNENKKSVQRIMRFDILNMQYWLPRQILQIPYDIMNRRNRKKLLKGNNSLVESIKMDDYFIDDAREGCFDLFYIAKK
jgi:2-polyprenyl-3-methyl-5-hydroxy-6-metoxy-1,4-benzoquinol methylase